MQNKDMAGFKIPKRGKVKMTRRGKLKLVPGEESVMDRNFIDKFNFIMRTIQSFILLVAVIVAFIYVAKFSYRLGIIESKISVLEEMVPLTPIKTNSGVE